MMLNQGINNGLGSSNIPKEKVFINKYAEELLAPLNVSIEVTSNCNVKCIHCYNTWQGGRINHSYLDKEKVDRIINQLVDNGIFSMGITGGEPLMKKDIVFYLIENGNKYGITTRLNSNLMMLDKETVNVLKRLQLKSILTSLTSFDEEIHDKITGKKGNFQKVIKGIKLALENNIKVGVNMVVTKLNKDHVYETGKFLNGLGVKSFFATKGSWPVNMQNFDQLMAEKEDIIRSLEDLIKVKNDFGMKVDILESYPLCLLGENKDFNIFSKHKCTAGITTLTIGADGNIRPCNHADKTYGNIFDENMSDIWLRMKEWRTGELLPEKCKSCEFVFKCTGGCRMEANSAGDIKGMDPFSKTDNIGKISEMLKNLDIEKKDLKQKKIKIQPRMVFREDKNCFIIDIGDGGMTITKDSGVLLKKLLDRNYFTINELSEEFNVDVEILNNFFNYLLNKGFIKIL